MLFHLSSFIYLNPVPPEAKVLHTRLFAIQKYPAAPAACRGSSSLLANSRQRTTLAERTVLAFVKVTFLLLSLGIYWFFYIDRFEFCPLGGNRDYVQ